MDRYSHLAKTRALAPVQPSSGFSYLVFDFVLASLHEPNARRHFFNVVVAKPHKKTAGLCFPPLISPRAGDGQRTFRECDRAKREERGYSNVMKDLRKDTVASNGNVPSHASKRDPGKVMTFLTVEASRFWLTDSDIYQHVGIQDSR